MRSSKKHCRFVVWSVLLADIVALFLSVQCWAGSSREVRWNSNALVISEPRCPSYLYSIGTRPFASRRQIDYLDKLFDAGEIISGNESRVYDNRVYHNQSPWASFESRPTEVINPLYVGFQLERESDKFTILPNVKEVEGLGVKIDVRAENLLRRLANRILRQLSLSDPRAAEFFELPRVLWFFGVRYFLQPGAKNAGIFFHRDSYQFQGLVLTKRPRNLKGGRFLLRPHLARSSESLTRLQTRETRAIRVPMNRLFIFESEFAEHAVEDFDLTVITEPGSLHRDILGFGIK